MIHDKSILNLKINNNNNKLAKEQYIKRHDSVHNCTSTYARKQGYNWTKNTGMNMCQNQWKQVKEAR